MMDAKEARQIMIDAVVKFAPLTDEQVQAIEILRAEEEVAA
jgi:hypothetical protein